MPSQLPVPTISELLDFAGKAVRGLGDATGDTREGAVYELLYGPVAVVLAQEVVRDRDMFRAAYFDAAEGSDLTGLIKDKYGVDRALDTYGTGTARLQRPTAGAGSGRVYNGTRIMVWSSGTDPQIYVVTADTDAAASDLTVTVPIRSTTFGDLARANANTGALLDPVWDATWTIASLTCGAGSTFEKAEDFRARTRKLKRDQRVGYVTAMRESLITAGATDAIFFGSDYSFGSVGDVGVNVCYVSDAGGNASATLVQDCQIALEKTRMLGADLMVLPMTVQLYQFTATVTLWTDPGAIDQNGLRATMLGRLKQYLQDVYVPKKDGAAGALTVANPELVQGVAISLPASDATLSAANWPAALPRYKFSNDLTSISFAAPS